MDWEARSKVRQETAREWTCVHDRSRAADVSGGSPQAASALSYFLSVSDQVETEIRSEILLQPDPAAPVRCASAVMIQALPDCDLEFFNRMRDQLLSETAGKILNDPMLLADRKLETLTMLLCKTALPPAMDIAGVPAPRFVCNCSTEKIWQTARTMLGKEDFEKLLQENPDPVIRCQFCNKVHHYKADK